MALHQTPFSSSFVHGFFHSCFFHRRGWASVPFFLTRYSRSHSGRREGFLLIVVSIVIFGCSGSSTVLATFPLSMSARPGRFLLLFQTARPPCLRDVGFLPFSPFCPFDYSSSGPFCLSLYWLFGPMHGSYTFDSPAVNLTTSAFSVGGF